MQKVKHPAVPLAQNLQPSEVMEPAPPGGAVFSALFNLLSFLVMLLLCFAAVRKFGNAILK